MGDAFNMRHPLTGGGMTVGLSDVIVLRNLLRPLHDLHDAAALCKYLESFYILRKVRQTVLSLFDAVLQTLHVVHHTYIFLFSFLCSRLLLR